MSAAAGMAREGFMPFATTYAVFASRRAYDFICMAIAEENLNVKIVCALPGLTTGYGPSHQATEDIAIFRGMPNLTIIDPCDAHEIEQVVPAIAAHQRSGLHAPAARQRASRARRVRLHVRARQGQAAARRSRRADHLDRPHDHARARGGRGAARGPASMSACCTCPRSSPSTRRRSCSEASRTGRMVVVAENHTIVGGLGEAVAGLLLRSGVIPPAFRQIGLPDEFLDAGALPTLHDRYGISTDAVARQSQGLAIAVRSATMTTVGFIGLGSMGLPMAKNLVARGFAVRGFDVRPAAMDRLGRGGRHARSDARGCRRRHRRSRPDGRECGAGRGDPVRRRRPRRRSPTMAVVVLMATCPPGAVEAIAARVSTARPALRRRTGLGRRRRCQAATLTIMAAARARCLRDCEVRPRRLGDKVFHVGERPGQGAMVKTVNQLLCGVHIAVVGRGLFTGRQGRRRSERDARNPAAGRPRRAGC